MPSVGSWIGSANSVWSEKPDEDDDVGDAGERAGGSRLPELDRLGPGKTFPRQGQRPGSGRSRADTGQFRVAAPDHDTAGLELAVHLDGVLEPTRGLRSGGSRPFLVVHPAVSTRRHWRAGVTPCRRAGSRSAGTSRSGAATAVPTASTASTNVARTKRWCEGESCLASDPPPGVPTSATASSGTSLPLWCE